VLESKYTTRRKEQALSCSLDRSSAGHRLVHCASDGTRAGHLAPDPGSPEPSAGQLPYFILLSVFEALAFGLGISFLLFGFPALLRLARGSRLRSWAMYLSIGWFLVSWWPHDNLHIHNGDDLQGLLYIEYGFHVTLSIAAGVLAFSLLTLLKPEETGADPGGAARVH
jgi:hypothetical protein